MGTPTDQEEAGTLLGRETEVAAISSSLDRARKGSGGLMVIEGPAGIGKSSLLEMAAEAGEERGFAVLSARGSSLERDSEFGVVRQLMERPLLGLGEEERKAVLYGPAVAVEMLLGNEPTPVPKGEDRDRAFDIFHGLYWLLVNLSDRQPLLVVLDDAHWADRNSLMAGGYVSRRLDGLPVLMIAAQRPDEPGLDGSLRRSILNEPEATAMHLDPLDPAGVRALLEDAFPATTISADLVGACESATGGNPFYLNALIAELAEYPDDISETRVNELFEGGGPTSVKRSVVSRLNAISPDAYRLAQTVAVMGGSSEIRHAADAAGMQLEEANVLADKLVAASIMNPGAPLRFTHPLVMNATSDVSPAMCSEIHRRAFEVLYSDGVPEAQLIPHALAARSSGNQDLVGVLRKHARRTASAGAPEEAVKCLRRAMAEPPDPSERPSVMADLGHVEVRSGDFEEGMSHLRAALALMDETDSRLEIYRDQAFAAFAGSGLEEARLIVRSILSGLTPDSDEAIQLQVDLAVLAWLSGQDHGLELERYESVSGATKAERMILALLVQEGMATGTHPDQLVELGLRALGDGRLLHEDTSESFAWYMIVYALITCEALDEARNTIAQAVADGKGRGSAFASAGAIGARGELALAEGRPADAEVDALTAAKGGIPPIMAQVNSALLVRSLVEQGRLGEAEAAMVDGGIDRGPGGPTALRWIPWSRALLHEAQGRPDLVRLDLAPIQADEGTGHAMKSLPWRAVLARVNAGGKDAEGAAALAAEHLEWARWWGRPGVLGVAERAHALAGPDAERIERMRDAADSLSGSSLKVEEAKARLELGTWLCGEERVGISSQGKVELESAFELGLAAGARGVARDAGDALQSAGFRSFLPELDDLTASERRVAEFAASGKTNREIAQDLFVTPKTVENHLTRVYAKLGITSRRELNRVL